MGVAMVTEETTVSIEKSQRLPPPGLLWHYTTIDVLEHFLQGEIAFSHYKFLNDDSELLYGRQLLQEIFDGLKSEGLKDFIRGELVDGLVTDVYMFCLSRDGDNLYQWRSYTPQGGIAVAFDRRKLHYAVQEGFKGEKWDLVSRNISGMLMPCRYRDDFVKRVVLRLNQRSNNRHGACCDGCIYIEKIMKVLLSQKNPSFREEQEERFLVIDAPRSEVTIINKKPRILVHDQGIAKSISCVRLSPHGDRERNKLFLEILRDKYELDFKIEQSISSYNGR